MWKLEYTYLAANVPQGHWVIVGGVSSGASWVDPTEFVHVVMDVGSSYGNTLKHNDLIHFNTIFILCS